MRPDPIDRDPAPPAFEVPSEPLIFAHRCGRWELSRTARVVGILNVTPDSFFDGGRFASADRAVERAERMIEDGADAIDIGGQSTRPGGKPVAADEEWSRIGPVLEALAGRVAVPISVDTYRGTVARRALDAGAAILNDVSGLSVDPSMAEDAARTGAGLVIMHSLGAPDRLHEPREYRDLPAEVRGFLADRMRDAEARGVARERIVLDPGVGFSKRAEQSVEILRALPLLTALGRPLYIGLSRKSFLGVLTGGQPVAERLAAGLGATAAAFARGARIFRTHDVRETRDALRTAEALLAMEPAPAPPAPAPAAAARPDGAQPVETRA